MSLEGLKFRRTLNDLYLGTFRFLDEDENEYFVFCRFLAFSFSENPLENHL